MPPKRHLRDPPPPAPASASSSTDDELEESENDAVEETANGVSDGQEYEDEKSDDDEEEEDDHHNIKNSSAASSFSKASRRQSSSDSGDGSTEESDSDADSDKTQPSPSVLDFTIKPVVSKSTKDSGRPNKNAAKRNLAPPSASTIAAVGSKRANESNTEEKESKKRKVSNGQDEDVKKVSGAQRLWSEEDEVVILKGIIDYQSKKGTDPCADMAVFHEYIKDNLHAEVNKSQLASKVRTVKKKFVRNATKGENGEDPVFTKPLDQKIFELSKKIWGYATTTNGVDKRKATPSKGKNSLASPSPKLEMDLKKEEPNGEMNGGPPKSSSDLSFLDKMLLSEKLMLPESTMSIVKEAMPSIGSSKAKELERKWKKLQEDELLLYMKRVELIHESSKLLLDAMKSST